MKLSVAVAALAATTSAVAANNAIVKSNCPFPVYLQSFPYDGSTPGPFTIIKPGGAAYTEAYRDGGSTIKLSKKRTLADPLFFGYTNQQSMVYYELNNDNGDEFADFRNKLIPSSPACQRFNCGPNKDQCYSNGHDKVPGCAKPVNLTVQLCA